MIDWNFAFQSFHVTDTLLYVGYRVNENLWPNCVVWLHELKLWDISACTCVCGVAGSPGCGTCELHSVLGRRLANTSQSYAGRAWYDVSPSPQRDRETAVTYGSDPHAFVLSFLWVLFHFRSRNLGTSVFTGPSYWPNAIPHHGGTYATIVLS
jgi:hypothetical protein